MNKIVVHWEEDDKWEVYASLSLFSRKHPEFNLDTLKYHITRNKRAYVTDEIMVLKCEYITPKN